MTQKIYKSAMGKPVDLGALLLQNEQVRAVGNMGVNAAGDLVDSTNRVIDQRNRQVQRQYRRQTNVSATPIATSNVSAKKMQETVVPTKEEPTVDDIFEPVMTAADTVGGSTDTGDDVAVPRSGGLAAAIARNREIKQELEKTRRQKEQEQNLRKI